MNDIFPACVPRKASETLPTSEMWQWFEQVARSVLQRYGYQNLMAPIVEPTALFVRGIGEVTDIVEKEMYSFEDSMNGDKLTLRPEHTAGIVRVDHRAQRAVQRPAAPVGDGPGVPPRAPAEGPLPPVQPARRRGAGLCRAGRRRRADPAHAHAAARAGAEGGRARPPRDQQPGPAGRARRAPCRAGRVLRGQRRAAGRGFAAPPHDQPAAHPGQQEPGDAGDDRRRAQADGFPRRRDDGALRRRARRAGRRRPRVPHQHRAWCAAWTTTT